MFRKLALSIATFVYFFASPSLFAQNTTAIGISPVTVDIVGKPGATSSQELYVFNQGSGPFLFVCGLEDYWYENDKGKTAPLGTFQERQAGAWIQCSPNRKIIPPQGREKVQVLAAIPEGADGDSFAMLYAQMRPVSEAKSSGTQSLQTSARIGARTTVRALGTEKPNAEILEAKVTREKKFQVFSAKLKNIGNTYLAGKGTLVLSNSTTNTLTKVDITLPFTFPTMSKEISANLIQSIPSGSYQAVLSIAGENGGSLVEEFKIQVP